MRGIYKGAILGILAASAIAGFAWAQANSSNPGYSDAQAVAACQAQCAAFAQPNLQMPNGAYIAHTQYVATNSATISGTTPVTCFGTSGMGSQTMPAVAFYPGARFRLECGGQYSTGVASVAALVINVKVGGTTVTTFTTPALPTNVAGLFFKADVTCTVRASGASGVVVCTGGVSYTTSLLGASVIFNPLTTANPVSVDLSGGAKLDILAGFTSLIGSPAAVAVESSIEQVN